jgi:hypothetical protein
MATIIQELEADCLNAEHTIQRFLKSTMANDGDYILLFGFLEQLKNHLKDAPLKSKATIQEFNEDILSLKYLHQKEGELSLINRQFRNILVQMLKYVNIFKRDLALAGKK